MRNYSNMPEKDALHRVCMEPLIYAFAAPRTVSSTLCEYEQYLQEECLLPGRRVRAILRTLTRLLDPVEAPLVSLTPELLKTLLREEAEYRKNAEHALGIQRKSLTCPSETRARRFFAWAAECGYITRDPFAELFIPPVAINDPATDWLA